MFGLGLGDFIEKKILGSPEQRQERQRLNSEKVEKEQKLNSELEEIRWNARAERKKKKAALESPSRVGRVLNTLGEVGERSSAASKGLVGGATIDPSGGMGNFGFGGGKGGGGMGFSVVDPLAFPGGSHKRKGHKGSRHGGGQEIHVHVHTERERGRHRR